MYKAIIFDFFDVIHRDPFKAWLKKHKFVNENELQAAMKPYDMGEITTDEFLASFEALTGHSIESIKKAWSNNHIIDPEFVPFISKLNQNYKVGLLSNASSEEIRPLIEKHDYDKLFNYIMVSGEHGLIKPTPEAFSHILDELGVKANETIFVDDSLKNVEGANKIGVTGLLFQDLEKLKTDLAALDIKF